MVIRLGINQLDIDTNLVAGDANAPLDDISDSDGGSELGRPYRLALVGERGISG